MTKITSTYTNDCSAADLLCIAAFLGMTAKQVAAHQKKDNLRSAVGTKLAAHLSSTGVDFVELENLPSDLAREQQAEQDIGNAGKNNKAGRRATTKWHGAYEVVKDGRRAGSTDEDSEIFNALYTCSSFEEFFAKAPAKEVLRGKKHENRVNTANASVGYAVKNGWIKPLAM